MQVCLEQQKRIDALQHRVNYLQAELHYHRRLLAQYGGDGRGAIDTSSAGEGEGYGYGYGDVEGQEEVSKASIFNSHGDAPQSSARPHVHVDHTYITTPIARVPETPPSASLPLQPRDSSLFISPSSDIPSSHHAYAYQPPMDLSQINYQGAISLEEQGEEEEEGESNSSYDVMEAPSLLNFELFVKSMHLSG